MTRPQVEYGDKPAEISAKKNYQPDCLLGYGTDTN